MIALMAQNDFHCQSTLSSTFNENGTIYYDQGEEVLFEQIWQRRLCEIQESFKCIFSYFYIFLYLSGVFQTASLSRFFTFNILELFKGAILLAGVFEAFVGASGILGFFLRFIGPVTISPGTGYLFFKS